MKILTGLVLVAAMFLPAAVFAMAQEGCGAGTCNQCHSMSVQEAKDLLADGVDEIHRVDFAEMPGLFMVEAERQGKKFPLYVDFSKQYVVAGNIIRIKDNQNVTAQRRRELNRVDTSRIPMEDALLLGKADAKTKVTVFTDPQCPYCKKLHHELKEVVRRDPDIAFYIKLFPLKIHPDAYRISQSIICSESMALLEASLEGKKIPDPICQTRAVDQTLALVQDLGIRSTPTLVLPDGRVMPGYKKADALLTLLGSKTAARNSD